MAIAVTLSLMIASPHREWPAADGSGRDVTSVIRSDCNGVNAGGLDAGYLQQSLVHALGAAITDHALHLVPAFDPKDEKVGVGAFPRDVRVNTRAHPEGGTPAIVTD